MASKAVLEALRRVPTKNAQLTARDFDLSGNTSGERSKIAEFQADVPLAVRPGEPVEIRIVAYETKTDMPGDGSQITMSLSNDLVDVDVIANDVVVYQGDSLNAPDSVDYTANEITVTDDGTGNDLHVYYVVADQAEFEIIKKAPQNVDEDLIETDAGLANLRDQYKDPVEFDSRYPMHGVIPVDWKVQVYLNAPFSLQWADDTDTDAEATNMAISLPIRKAQRNVEGLEQAVKSAIVE